VPDFRRPHHLPKVRGDGDPPGLPRQRRGTTPQQRGRYPDYDVLESREHWDETTRRVVLSRVEKVPQRTFFTLDEEETLDAFADVVLHQTGPPRIPVLRFVDAKLAAGRGEGYRYVGMPDDGETWRRLARGLDEAAEANGAPTFVAASDEQRTAVVEAFADGRIEGPTWTTLDAKHAWSIVMRDLLTVFYAHPWSWNEIGFGGPAYPRGYARLGVGLSEEWEGEEAFELDPVRDVRERGIE
jgi:hypothetical protein